ncbi:MAG TPA: fimbria/pilus outer membrane usher protein [Allosphingosinicella sp.]|uniref:fimbria/pilus outer membrane usher protein n=1 Tax=Allosphingosinicella sp. TaxID=2823234 RepID=UPI002ED78F35
MRTHLGKLCLCAAILLSSAMASAAELPSQTLGSKALTPIYLDVSINGRPDGEAQLLLSDDKGQFYASARAFKTWRLRLPAERPVQYEGDSYYRLAPSQSLVTSMSSADQSLHIQAAPALFERKEESFDSSELMPMTPAGIGGFLNYDLVGERSRHETGLNGAAEMGFFSSAGVFSTTLIGRTSSTSGTSVSRLETNWTIDRPGTMSTLRIGDTISAGGPSAPPVRFAGIQFQRNFRIRPGFVSAPLPTISGAAALPSTVDIYVNNNLQGSREVEPGPFAIRDIPIQSGGGNLTLVLRDALGRETLSTQSYYLSGNQLRKGLHDFSYSAGFLRNNFASKSNDYGEFLVRGSHRYGWTDNFTVEGHAAASRSNQQAGMAAVTAIPGLGIVDTSFSLSSSAQGKGAALGIGIDRRSRSLSLGLRTEMATAGYRFLGMEKDEQVPAFTAQAFADFKILNGIGGLNYVRRDYRHKEDQSLAGAFYSVDLRHLGHLRLFVQRSVGRGQRNTVVGGFLTVALGNNASGFVRSEYDARSKLRGSISFERSAATELGSAYGASAEFGSLNRGQAHYSINTPVASYGVEAATGSGQAAIRLSTSGSLGFISGRAFASRRLGDSFGLVKLDGLRNVHIYADGNLVGRTDRAGTLVIPRMRPFERNILRLEDADLPIDVVTQGTEVAVRPYGRSGNVITFPFHRERGAILVVRLEDGTALPAGTRLLSVRSNQEFPATSGGEVYVPELVGRFSLQAVVRGRRCTVSGNIPANADPQPRIAGLICREEAQHASN